MAAVSVKKKKSLVQSSKPIVRMCVLDHREHITMASPEHVWPIPMRAIGAQNLLTMPGGVSTAGYLHKKGGSQFSLLKWPLRYIIIHKGCVYYFKSSTSAAPQGAFSLNGYNRVMRAAEETTSSNVFPFKIVHFSKKHRTWMFSAASEEERRSWMRKLRREIDHYNDRQESHTTSSDTDSDADSFYGTIERPLDLKHPIDNTDDGFTDEDDDEDEDYLKPDSSPTTTSRPNGPPPSYPPPPVPLSALSNQLPPDSKAPPLPPPIHRTPTSPLPKKPPPPIPPQPTHKHMPPDLPFASHLQRPTPFPSVTPPLPPPNPRRAVSRPRPGENLERPPPITLQMPATLPICEKLESHLQLNHPVHSQTRSPAPIPVNSRARSPSHSSAHSPSDNQAHRATHNPPHSQAPSPASSPAHSQARSPTHCSIQSPTHISVHGPSQGNHSYKPKPKPPPLMSKPLLPTSRKHPSTISLGASPEGQSFRASGDELPMDIKARWKQAKSNQNSPDEEDDDDDYENVQLPDSVYIDSTETSFVEKLFRECGVCSDGLYAIRNSGTKTSKVLVVWDVSMNRARNYRLFEENGCIYLDSELTFPSLAILIEHYYNHPLPQHGSLCLKKPYSP
ncbi:SH3 domain-binding protein 2 isoform X1 [Periophthalmus magnuspinnatus]|uniref:SH3 domain-binding protein 2 isoform X1 n=1 Tax=Periophthalmus magnuspinnatus TaxID=409849 RepID=UPI0024372E84|nr:SH3 domain-binding protein 2 isoform X1 [Periophthalmus magnuspinnatus]